MLAVQLIFYKVSAYL